MIEEEKALSSYEFGPFVVDESRRRLLRGGETVPLTRKEFDTLLILVRGGGSLVTKDELMEAVWPGTHVEEGNLAVHISGLRRKLGRRENGTPYIETETGRGYRFNAMVREVEDFDLIIRKRTRAHIVTHEVEETDRMAPAVASSRDQQVAAGAIRPLAPAVTRAAALWGFTWRAAIVLAAAGVAVAGITVALHNSSRGAAGSERSAAGVRTLAVMPFTLLNGRADDEYLGMGMADALITRLSNARQVTVRPTSAVRGFAGSGRDAAEVGRQLGVEGVLEGSIQKTGERVRVTAQLVRPIDGAVLWAGTFDEPLTNALTIEDSISEQLTRALARLFDSLRSEPRYQVLLRQSNLASQP
jgi:DNA-binding winged helix-turn-helix (wHTH) protein/TolB-like protein